MAAQQPLKPFTTARWIRAILVIFFLMGFGFGTWLSRLPTLRDSLGASTLEMSGFGLCLAVGSLAGMALSARAIERFGPRKILALTITVQAVALPLSVVLMLAGAIPLGIASLFVYGLSFSTADVAMNVSGANAERVFGRPRLPLMHAYYSIGAMVSMGVGSATEAVRVSLQPHFIVVGVLFVLAGFAVLGWVPGDEAALRNPASPEPLMTVGPVPVVASATGDELATVTGSIPVIPARTTTEADDRQAATAAKRRRNPWRDPRVICIGLITLVAGLVEGSPGDWLPLALVDGHGATNEFGSLMLGLFYGAIVTARLAGSAVLLRFPRVAVLRTSLAVAAAGILTVVLATGPVPVVLGTLLWGLGAGVCWPIAISAAADRVDTAARDVAAVSAIGYTSMLLGPMAFGVLGWQVGLLPAFLVLPVFVVLGFSLAGVTRERAQ